MLPVIETDRLILRPFTLEDASNVAKMANDYELYKTTLNLPYPYEPHMATAWIVTHEDRFINDGMLTLAVVVKETDTLVGAISLGKLEKHRSGEIGYWIGKAYWGNGYAEEATNQVIGFGFEMMGLNRILGRYLAINPASGRVMSKCGMRFEGVLKEAIVKEQYYHDVGYYGLTRLEWLKAKGQWCCDPMTRRAKAEDAYALSLIQRLAFAEDLDRYGDRSDCPANETAERLREKIEAYDYFVFLENDRIVGGADVRHDVVNQSCRLARIYIDPKFQDLGLGKRIIAELEAEYEGVKKWTLDTPYHNYRNHHFYMALGYRKVGEKVIDDVLTLFEYEKHLD